MELRRKASALIWVLVTNMKQTIVYRRQTLPCYTLFLDELRNFKWSIIGCLCADPTSTIVCRLYSKNILPCHTFSLNISTVSAHQEMIQRISPLCCLTDDMLRRKPWITFLRAFEEELYKLPSKYYTSSLLVPLIGSNWWSYIYPTWAKRTWLRSCLHLTVTVVYFRWSRR